MGVLLTPPIMAAFVAATVSRSSPDGSDSYELTPFMATRPLSSASLIAAKLKATIPSTLVYLGCWSSLPSRWRSGSREPGRW